MSTPESAQHRGIAGVRARVRGLPGGWLAWRIGVSIVGGLIIIIGIVLLPLPGPGWLVIFVGLGVWGTEFEWAARLLTWTRGVVRQWTDWIKRQPRWLQGLVGLAGVLFLAGIALGSWYLL
jgi:uncharacterized protein (TIGR02611 family)